MTISVARMDVAIRTAGTGVPDLELFARIADQNSVKTRIGRTKARFARCLPNCSVHELAIEPQLLAGFNFTVLALGGLQ